MHAETLQGGMSEPSISLLTICGVEELERYGASGVTHILSILDPTDPEPSLFRSHDPRCRVMLRFHDDIEPGPGVLLPQVEHVRAILAFGELVASDARKIPNPHVLYHCHMGISRSTAAMVMLLAQLHPDEDEHRICDRVMQLRPQAWPNCRMIGFADELLGRGGRLTAALGPLYAKQLQARPEMRTFMQQNRRGREVDMAEVWQVRVPGDPQPSKS
jgi:predicted protein tyrosine phosphatase